jgi:transposase
MPGYSTPTTKARICCDKAAGLHETEIAEKFGLHRTTVLRIVKWYTQTEDYYNIKAKPGRPHKFTPHDVHVAVRALARTKAHDVADLQRKYFPEINAQTIQTRLKSYSLNAYIRCTKPLLMAAHKAKQLEWAKAHADWSADNWKAVIFLDESKFNLFGSDGRSWCWRRPEDEFDQWYTKKVVKHGGG